MMPCSFLFAVMAGFALLPVRAQSDPPPLVAVPPETSVESSVESSGPPARPASRVLDRSGALTAPEHAGLSRQFMDAAADGLSLYFIVLNGDEGLVDHDAAAELARLWEDAPLTAVLLHVPGQPLSLGFAGTGLADFQPGETESLAQAALAAGRARHSMPEQGKTAARRLIEDYTRYRAGEPIAPALFPVIDPQHHPQQLLRWGGTAAVAFLGFLLLLARRQRLHRPRLFPLPAPRERFSAPHSGGNNAMISFPNSRVED